MFDARLGAMRPARGPASVLALVRIVVLALAVATVLASCAATTQFGPPKATPTDIGGIADLLRQEGVVIDDLVSGEAGCDDQELVPAAIAFDASGLDQPAPSRIRLFIFRNDTSYQKLRSSVDACAADWVTDPAAYEAIDVSPYVATAEGPWTPGFRAAVRTALTAAAGDTP